MFNKKVALMILFYNTFAEGEAETPSSLFCGEARFENL
jgi:hypothetical protein